MRLDRLPPPPEVVTRSPQVAVRGEVQATVPVLPGLSADAPHAPRLDARAHIPERPRRAVVICHPHPLYGGSMSSPVPLSLAKVLADKASETVAWARFDFRGVGASEGVYDDARGEVDDVRAVMAWLRAQAPGVPLSLCGHSFGSFVSLVAAARDGHVDRLLLLAPSTRFFAFARVVARGPSPELPPHRSAESLPVTTSTTIFLGDHDEFCDVDEGRALAEEIGADFRVFEGFDHHFLKSRRAVAEAALPIIAPEA
jgi:alpha/beta superfamily hydrolase